MGYFVLDDKKCLVEGLSREQILAAIVQAVETHEIADVDTGFVTTIKEQNAGLGLKFWVGTVAEYNAIPEVDPDCVYICTDSTDLQDFGDALDAVIARLDTLDRMRGETLLSTTVGYGDNLSVALTGTEIKNFNAVKVLVVGAGEVLCDVQVVADNDNVTIKGSAPAAQSSGDGLTLINVNLTCSKANNTLVRNRTTTAVITSSGATFGERSISSIRGVY